MERLVSTWNWDAQVWSTGSISFLYNNPLSRTDHKKIVTIQFQVDTSLKKKGNPKLIISESIKIDELRTLHDEHNAGSGCCWPNFVIRTLNKQIVFPTTYLFIYHLQSLPNPLENLSSIFLIVGILRSHVFSSQINMTPPFNPSPPLVLIVFEDDQLFGL